MTDRIIHTEAIPHMLRGVATLIRDAAREVELLASTVDQSTIEHRQTGPEPLTAEEFQAILDAVSHYDTAVSVVGVEAPEVRADLARAFTKIEKWSVTR